MARKAIPVRLLLILGFAAVLTGVAVGRSYAAPNEGFEKITVFKSPFCGCCGAWVEIMKDAGYTVITVDMEELSGIKKQASVSEQLEACHTAVIGDERKYVLEGHIPLEAIQRLTTEKPNVKGIAVPGMPSGSPGMGEDPDARFTVYAFTGKDGESPTVFLKVGAN